ncbi:cytosine permease [Klebsiella pneumoniae subsp. pneumoniae]|nr:cytosine permease [Klebsiella pneumoniae subsp. pneumoniae]
MSERRSIDYIPESERHGHPLASSPFGLAAICKITAIVTGALAVVLGGDVVWSLVGLLAGQMLGGGGDVSACAAGTATGTSANDP